jgi:rhodanese-related sulfurtransferase
LFVIFAVTILGMNQTAFAQESGKQVIAPVTKVNEIRKLQQDETKKDTFVLVDVRSVEEINVSVIKGAITKAQFERDIEKHKQKAIIVYCTSGVRSANYANQLKQKGWNAYNYKGSILDWCKNKLPLTTVDGNATNRVHTYSVWNRVPSQYKAVH